MTLIISLANPYYCIHLSDRRISRNQQPLDDETNKATLLTCESGRFAVGFTGLAYIDSFKTQEWLLKSLSDVVDPDYSITGMLERLRIKATHDFRTIPVLKRLPASQQRLSVLFSGFLRGYISAFLSVLLSNYEDETGKEAPEAWEEFKIYGYLPQLGRPFARVQAIGECSALADTHVTTLLNLLKRHLPPDALIHKGVEIIREAASSSKSRNSIGKQVSSILVPANLSIPHSLRYHTSQNQTTIYTPAMATFTRTRGITTEVQMQISGEGGLAEIPFPRIAPKAPCPCGSGKRYKHCHGIPELQ